MKLLKAILYCLPALSITALGVWFFFQDAIFMSILRWEFLIAMTVVTGLLMIIVVLFVFNLLKTGVQSILAPTIKPVDRKNEA